MSIAEACLWAFPLLLGVGLLLLSRWARRRNGELSQRNGKLLHYGFSKELRSGNFLAASRMIFFGNVGRSEALVGRTLAVIVIIAVTVALVGIAFALALR
jgi:hypothetical protein